MQEIRPQSGPQESMLASSADIMIGGGGAGGGKSHALLMEPIRHIGTPGFEAAIFRRTSPQITQTGGLWMASEEMYDALRGTPRESLHDWHFGTDGADSVIRFSHCQHDKNRLDFKGAQICYLGIDQVEEFSEAIFWYLWSRNRSTCGVRPYTRATCNPVPPDDPMGGWLHGLIGWWLGDDGYPIEERQGVLRWFLRVDDDLHWFSSRDEAAASRPALGIRDSVEPTSLTFIRARLEDNPALMSADPDYLSKLEGLPRVERMRLREGNWLVRAAAGEVFNRAWFTTFLEVMPPDLPAVRYWDKAGTKGGKGAESAGVLIAGPWKGQYIIGDVVHGRWSSMERNDVMMQVARRDGREVQVVTEQEPGSGGKESAETTIRMLAGWDVRADRVTGDKVTRAGPLSAQAEAGNIALVRGEWNDPFLRQAHSFPDGLKDMVDGATGGFNKLAESEDYDIDIELDLALAGTTRANPWTIR